jgi:hypothetical protein
MGIEGRVAGFGESERVHEDASRRLALANATSFSSFIRNCSILVFWSRP